MYTKNKVSLCLKSLEEMIMELSFFAIKSYRHCRSFIVSMPKIYIGTNVDQKKTGKWQKWVHMFVISDRIDSFDCSHHYYLCPYLSTNLLLGHDHHDPYHFHRVGPDRAASNSCCYGDGVDSPGDASFSIDGDAESHYYHMGCAAYSLQSSARHRNSEHCCHRPLS